MPISIPASAIEALQRNGVTIETRDSCALVGINMNFPGNTVTFTFAYGSPATNSFVQSVNPGPQTAVTSVTVNTANGSWTASTGQSGTLTGPQLTTLNTNQRTLRNSAETVANALGVIGGSVTAWT